MALLERYLSAVGRHLPAGKEDDILAELRDDIQARFDERASRLGRPLTVDEEADLLKPYGRPVLMAGRYARRQQLIGPQWFPAYWMTLKVALAVTLAVQVALAAVLIVAGRPTGDAVGRVAAFPFETAVTVFGWVTLVFGGLEMAASSEKFADNWDPRRLPRPKPVGLPRPSRVTTAGELVVYAVGATWWVALRDSPRLMHLPPDIAAAPAWTTFYWPVLLVIIGSMAVKCIVLVRPDWTAFRLAASTALTVAGIGIAGILLGAGPLFLAGESGAEALALAQIMDSVMRWGIGVGVVIAVVTTGLDVSRWLRHRKT